MGDASPQPDESNTTSDQAYIFKLQSVSNFDETNKNFDDVSNVVTLLIHEIRENSEVNNANLLRLAEETSQNLDKLASDIRAVLSSQTMMLVICFTVIGSAVVIIKAVYDILFGPIV